MSDRSKLLAEIIVLKGDVERYRERCTIKDVEIERLRAALSRARVYIKAAIDFVECSARQPAHGARQTLAVIDEALAYEQTTQEGQ